MTTYEEALLLTNKLSLVEKVKLLEHLSSALRHDLTTEAYKQMAWEQFLDATYSSFADDPIERNQPIQPDIRDSFR